MDLTTATAGISGRKQFGQPVQVYRGLEEIEDICGIDR
jgi:hypothetical protein